MAEGWKDPLYYKGGNGRSYRANRGLKEIQFSVNRVLQTRRYGHEREPVNWYQGSKSKGSLSGNTHAGWDAYDRTDFNENERNKLYRIHGVMDHNRDRWEGPWVPHGHGGVDGGAGSDALQGQIAEYHRNGDGLRGSRPDRGFKMRNLEGNRIFPLYVGSWRPYGKHGIYNCEAECGAYEYQSTSSDRLLTVEVDMDVSISAVTVVMNSSGRHIWGITDRNGDTPGGEVVYLENFRLVKEVSAL